MSEYSHSLLERCGYRNRSRGFAGWIKSQYPFSEKIGISLQLVGRIIGRDGSNVMRLENYFNVNVKIDKVRVMVYVSGQSEQNVSDAVKELRKQIDNFNGIGNGGLRKRGSYGGNKRSNGAARRSDREDDLPDLIDWDVVNKTLEEAQAARVAKYLPLTKDFYKERPEVANLSQEDVDCFRLENNITVSYVFEANESETAPPIPNPVSSFEQCFAEYPDLWAEVQKQGFPKPSPIQSQAWPILLKGYDMIGISQTGTGKTLAFLLPAMIHTEYQSTPRGSRGGPNVLVLVPTRDLALQIELEVKKYSFRNIKAVSIYGGGSRKVQISAVEQGAEIIICTPGRLNQLVNAGVIDVTSITYLVLDEADRLLDLGFEPQIRKALQYIRIDRQTIMTSATWPQNVRSLAQSLMKDPIQVVVGSLDLAAALSVKQLVEHMKDDDDKYEALKAFISRTPKTDKILVFCNCKARVVDLSTNLSLNGIEAQSIYGQRDQVDRERAIADIRSGAVRVLIATDLVSRGLDIKNIAYVFNYDFPRNMEEYVHRIGRTGRAGCMGTSITYITRDDWSLAKKLIHILEKANQVVPEELRRMGKKFAKRGRGGCPGL